MNEHRLIQAGAWLFLLGLLTGFAIPAAAAPRLALSGHLEGVMNGIVLMVVGLMWPRLVLPPIAAKIAAALLLYGTYANWLAVSMAGLWGAGSAMLPIAGGTATGTAFQEGLLRFGLISLSVAMVLAFVIIVWGLRGVRGRQTLSP